MSVDPCGAGVGPDGRQPLLGRTCATDTGTSLTPAPGRFRPLVFLSPTDLKTPAMIGVKSFVAFVHVIAFLAIAVGSIVSLVHFTNDNREEMTPWLILAMVGAGVVFLRLCLADVHGGLITLRGLDMGKTDAEIRAAVEDQL